MSSNPPDDAKDRRQQPVATMADNSARHEESMEASRWSVAGMKHLLRATYGRELWAAIAYAGWTIAAGLAASIAVFVLLAFGGATIIVWVGVPLLLAALLVSRLHLGADLWLQTRLFHRETPVPPWPGDRTLSAWAQLRLLLQDRITWAGLVWSLSGFPIAIVWIIALPLLTLGPIILLTAPAWFALSWDLNSDTDSTTKSFIAFGFGLVAMVVAPRLLRLGAAATASLATAVPRIRQDTFGDTIARLRSERDLSLASVDYARRRMERDLHDGVQPHLTAAAMTLARAQHRVGTDQPIGPLLDEALEQITTGMTELRRFVRGLGPASLDGTSLATALRGLAAGVPGRLTVRCSVEDVPVPLRTVAYFVASESVTNAVRHAAASDIVIDVGIDDVQGARMLTIAITDNGRGGATMVPGGGLMGLHDRVGAVGGTLNISSPPGGPTTVSATIPCDF